MAQRTRASQKAYRDTQITTNGSGLVTAAKHRAVEEDDYDSTLFFLDDVLDEDDMASDSASKVPTQQSVKAYVDAQAEAETSGIIMEDHFVSFGQFSSTTTNSGYVNSSAYGVGDEVQGVYGVFTSTTTNATASFRPSANINGAVKLGGSVKGHTFKMRMAMPTLSDGTDTFTVYFGIANNALSTEPTSGVYYRYTHSVNSGKFEAVTANGGTRTAADTGITADTSYHLFEARVNAAGSSVGFYIDDVLVATNTTNIPTSASLLVGVSALIVKSAGTTERSLVCDYLLHRLV